MLTKSAERTRFHATWSMIFSFKMEETWWTLFATSRIFALETASGAHFTSILEVVVELVHLRAHWRNSHAFGGVSQHFNVKDMLHHMARFTHLTSHFIAKWASFVTVSTFGCFSIKESSVIAHVRGVAVIALIHRWLWAVLRCLWAVLRCLWTILRWLWAILRWLCIILRHSSIIHCILMSKLCSIRIHAAICCRIEYQSW